MTWMAGPSPFGQSVGVRCGRGILRRPYMGEGMAIRILNELLLYSFLAVSIITGIVLAAASLIS